MVSPASGGNLWLWLLPATAFVVPIVTILTTYILAEEEHHVEDAMTFISATFDNPPESCIGAFGMSITSTLLVLVSLFRFRFVDRTIDSVQFLQNLNHLKKVNGAALALGLVMALSLAGLGSFQFSNAKAVHLTFSGLFFLSGLVQLHLLFFLDRKLELNGIGWRIFAGVLVFITTAAFFVGIIAYIIIQVKGRDYILHTISAVSEQAGVLAILLYYSSYVNEFRFISVEFVVHNERHREAALDSVRLTSDSATVRLTS